LDAQEQIDVLLAEYASIRQLAYTRISNFYQVVTIGPPILILAANNLPVIPTLFVLIIGGMLIPFLLWHTVTDVERAHEFLLHLEDDVNARAGFKLLTWEHEFGGRVVGNWYPRLRRFFNGRMLSP
jgi:hypothetical protein